MELQPAHVCIASGDGWRCYSNGRSTHGPQYNTDDHALRPLGPGAHTGSGEKAGFVGSSGDKIGDWKSSDPDLTT